MDRTPKLVELRFKQLELTELELEERIYIGMNVVPPVIYPIKPPVLPEAA